MNNPKICSKCQKEKETTCFNKDKQKKDGFSSSCTECRRRDGLASYYRNKHRTKEHLNELAKARAKTEPYRAKSRARAKRLRQDPFFRLMSNFKTALWRCVVKHKDSHWTTLLGYSIEELRDHLEKQFKPGMSWDNYGRNGWHIDHIRPISSFNTQQIGDAEFMKCWALDNLQPLWEADNIRKSNFF